MIVADTNLLAGLFFAGARARVAQRVLELDPAWLAPPLWRSEFRSVLRKYVGHASLNVADASKLMDEAALVYRQPGARAVDGARARAGEALRLFVVRL